jgi:hypothetical protein
MTLMNVLGCVWLLVFWLGMVAVAIVAAVLLLHWVGIRW